MCVAVLRASVFGKPGAGMHGDLAVNLQRYKNTPGPNSTMMDGGRRGFGGGAHTHTHTTQEFPLGLFNYS